MRAPSGHGPRPTAYEVLRGAAIIAPSAFCPAGVPGPGPRDPAQLVLAALTAQKPKEHRLSGIDGVGSDQQRQGNYPPGLADCHWKEPFVEAQRGRLPNLFAWKCFMHTRRSELCWTVPTPGFLGERSYQLKPLL